MYRFMIGKFCKLTKLLNHQQAYDHKPHGYEYDVDSVLDNSDHVLQPPPKIISSSSSSSSNDSSSHHKEFAFLKRQHNLKESLEDNGQTGHAPKLDKNHDRGSAVEDSVAGSTSDTFGASGGGIKCRNSIQGKLLIADDRGYVCPRKVVGINGCCSTDDADHQSITSTKLYSCDSCHKNGCCAVYENCISCCMAPSNRELLNRLVSEKKSPVFKIFIASISDYFELCLTKCRTSSASVQHENTYRNPAAKHCYSDNVVDEDGGGGGKDA